MWRKFKRWLVQLLSDGEDDTAKSVKSVIHTNITNTISVDSIMNPTLEQEMELKELIKKRKAAIFNLESLNLRIESLVDDIERIEID